MSEGWGRVVVNVEHVVGSVVFERAQLDVFDGSGLVGAQIANAVADHRCLVVGVGHLVSTT